MSQAASRGNGEVHPILVTVAVMLAALMQVLDTTIANVALPNMQGSLSATQDQIAWVLTSYIVASAIMTPPTGWLADRFGRRKVFLTAIVTFIVGSILCGLATSLAEIVVFRIIQGLGGAALVPLSQAILLDTYPREKHGLAMAIFGIGVVLGPILGPTLGGYLTEYYNWRWVFFINVPIGILAFTMSGIYVPTKGNARVRRFDAFGFIVLSLGIGALQLMLDRGQSNDWFSSMETVIEGCVAAGGFYIFMVHASFKEHAFVDLRLFKDRNFALGVTIMFVLGMVLLASMALIPPMLQNVFGYPVMETGLVLAPRGIGAMCAMMLVSRIITRVDPRAPIMVGLLLLSFSTFEMSHFSPQMGEFQVVWTGFIQGLGLGQVFVPLSALTFSTLPSAMRNEATSIYNLMRNIGMSVGVSIVFTILARSSQTNHSELASNLTPWNESLDLAARHMPVDVHSTLGLEVLNGMVSKQAAMISFLNDFHLMAIIGLCCIPIVLLMERPRYPSSDSDRDRDETTGEAALAAE